MSILLYFLKAWVMGIALSAPIGPIAMLCIKKTLELGMMGALLVGLGSALADLVFAFFSLLGFSAISTIMMDNSVMLRLVGGVFLLVLAYIEARNSKKSERINIRDTKPVKIVFEVFLLTMLNPLTILSFMGIFAAINIGPLTKLNLIMMVLGIFLGSMTWWCILGAIITKIRHKLPEIWTKRIKSISCFILAVFGLVAILSSFIN